MSKRFQAVLSDKLDIHLYYIATTFIINKRYGRLTKMFSW